eukprot:TRINITY_DN10651_c3_g1_i1.p1 TRINITY_DN10651_c3_g1~~TRINITY_DN10651_c3_g1_i1.p1  ORF type:complete len:103 (+),score=20.00 TRINITY_DN10651_c3_g1_i1:38-346(+)
MSSFKRLKVSEDNAERVDWRNPRFSDWKLTWSSSPECSEAKSWPVHRCVLVGGERAAHFFCGATREGAYDSDSTDLSALLPEACKAYMDQALDFIYGQDIGN